MFTNKYIDYSSKTKKELYQTLILFLILSNKTIVSIVKRLLQIALFLRLPILGIIRTTVFKHFCGGENIIKSQTTIFNLGKSNIKTILDYSVEGKNDETSFDTTYREILKNLEEASKNDLIPFCVFKVTGIARFKLLSKINKKEKLTQEETEEFKLIVHRFNKICEQAVIKKTPILIDAEESWIQNTIDDLVESMMKTYNKNKVMIYNTIQLYRFDKLNYIKRLHQKSKKEKYKLGLKLVRGAYMEKERLRAKIKKYTCPIHIEKINCDEDYDQASKYCLDNIDNISLCFGTHNEQSTEKIIHLMKQSGLPNNDKRIYFSQLLGMSDNMSFYLGHFNYNVAKYVPYGPVKEVLPYLIRRAEENSAITGQTNREIIRIRELINKF